MKKIAATIAGSCISLLSFATPGIVKEQPAKSIAFAENKGQVTDQFGNPRPDINFKIEAQGFNVFIGDGQLHYQWSKMTNNTSGSLLENLRNGKKADITTETYRMDVTLVGANKNAHAITSDQQEYAEHYYTDALNDAVVHSFKKITYQNVYPNIDWVLYTAVDDNGKTGVKYDFVVRPGGHPADIKLQYAGATSLSLKNDGSLLAKNPMGELNEEAPYSYTMNEGVKTAVSSHYTLSNNQLSFSTGNYTGTLVIDPALQWATYYGGSGFIELSTGLACDGAANVYMTGMTTSTNNIASTGSFQTTFGGGFFDGYLVKLDSTGARKWATYYGGTGDEYTWGVACDKWYNIFLSGSSPSNSGIATANGYQPTKTGSNTVMFLARFDSTGARKWGTYYGAANVGIIGLCAVDNKGGVFLSGNPTAGAAALVTTGAFQTTLKGSSDALLVKFDTSCARQWATYFGSDSAETSIGLACDTVGNVFIAGSTKSPAGIATNGSYQSVYAGLTDQYVAKFNGAGNRIWSTYYGGLNNDLDGETNTIGTDSKGDVYLSGRTLSLTGIASPNAFQPTFGGGAIDAFLVKFDSTGARQWGTYYGGSAYDVNSAITTNSDGETLMTGYTSSTNNIATPGSVQPANAGGQYDAYLVRFDANGQRIWGTYYGGTGSDAGYGVAFAQEQSSVFFAGTTSSATGIATPGSFQSTIGGSSNSFIAKLCVAAIPVSNTVTGDVNICINTTHTYSIPANSGNGYIWSLPNGWTGSSTTNTITATAGTLGGMVSVKIIKCNDTSASRFLLVNMNPYVPAVITGNGTLLSTTNTFASYQWFFNGQPISGATGATYTALHNGDYRVAGTTAQGCTDTSVVFSIGFLSVNNIKGSDISIYPNPATNIIHINAPAEVLVNVYSVDSKLVLSQTNATDMDISSLANGIYVVRIGTRDGRMLKTAKLTKAAF